jgi:hypothetical protein
VSPLTQAVTLTGVKALPEVDWPAEEPCEIGFDRLVVRGTPFDDLDVVRLNVQTTGGTATLGCIPPEPRAAIAATGITEIRLSRLTFALDYRASSSAATLRLHSVADGLAAVSLDAEFDYLWFDARQAIDEPRPVAFLRSARLEFENLGVWEGVRGLLPPPLTDPAMAPAVIFRILSEELPVTPGIGPSPMRKALAASASEAWTAFLANPDRLVLETGFDPDHPAWLNLMRWDAGPDVILDDLEPRLALLPSSTRVILPAALVSRALATPEQLSEAERIEVGTALATGVGAPRDLASARALLDPAVAAGSGDAALVLARALAAREPESAYRLALQAAAGGAPGAAGLLDRVEGGLPFERVLELQDELALGHGIPPEALARLSRIREEASMRLTGNGRTRSYATAAFFALIGAAAADSESAGILEEIDVMMRAAGPDAVALWRVQEAAAADRARAIWVERDLPATLGGGN